MPERRTIHLDCSIEKEVTDLIQQGQNLLAIKKIVDATGASVTEAMGWVDRYFRRQIAPCPYCGESLQTNQAKQCFECGMDWRDGNQIVQRG